MTIMTSSLYVVAGFLAGLAAAGFGLGGALVATPAIRLLGTTAAFAVGSTLPPIVPNALLLSYRYAKKQLVDWSVVVPVVLFAILGSTFGTLTTHWLNGHVLMIVTAGFLLVSAATVWFQRGTVDDSNNVAPARPHLPVLATIGISAGFLGGLLGLGGGIVLVPAFSIWLKFPVKKAIATALACGGWIALYSTIAHIVRGDIDWRVAVLLGVGMIPGGYVGSHFAAKVSDAHHRRAFAILVGVIGLVFGISETVLLVQGS